MVKIFNPVKFIWLGGLVNTCFLVFHLFNDWANLTELPMIIVLSILAVFSISAFMMPESLLTKGYGKIIFWVFIVIYTLRAVRSIQTFIEGKEGLNIESVLIFIGCVLCIFFFINAMVLFYKMRKSE